MTKLRPERGRHHEDGLRRHRGSLLLNLATRLRSETSSLNYVLFCFIWLLGFFGIGGLRGCAKCATREFVMAKPLAHADSIKSHLLTPSRPGPKTLPGLSQCKPSRAGALSFIVEVVGLLTHPPSHHSYGLSKHRLEKL